MTRDIAVCVNGGDHDWKPSGMLGPYLLEACQRADCRVTSICPAAGYPAPLDVLIRALERAGCEPRRVP